MTLDTTGRMLLGTDIAAVLAILEGMPIDVIGLNCSTGPDYMREPIRYLGETSPPAGLLHPQCRAAPQRGRAGGLPARARTLCRYAGRICRKIRRQHRWRLLRHHPRTSAPAGGKSCAVNQLSPPDHQPAAPGLRHPGDAHAAGAAALPDRRAPQHPGQPEIQEADPGRRF